jgi:hypothetical protein
MTAFGSAELLQRVDNGLTVVPIADVYGNYGLLTTLSAAVGQLETVEVAA